jgi:hypothetical protein
MAEIDVDHGDDRTTLRFAACGMIDIGGPTASRLRMAGGADMAVRWLLRTHQRPRSSSWKIGGKDGVYDKASTEAAVQVQNDVLVVFELSAPAAPSRPPSSSTFSPPSSGHRIPETPRPGGPSPTGPNSTAAVIASPVACNRPRFSELPNRMNDELWQAGRDLME